MSNGPGVSSSHQRTLSRFVLPSSLRIRGMVVERLAGIPGDEVRGERCAPLEPLSITFLCPRFMSPHVLSRFGENKSAGSLPSVCTCGTRGFIALGRGSLSGSDAASLP